MPTTDRLRDGLAREIGAERILSGPSVERTYESDAYNVDRSQPTVVVLPESTEEVAKVVRWCRREGVPFTARGAGTGLSGGAMPALGGVVISTKKLNRILEIDLPNRRLRAQAGVTNIALSKAVAAHGLHFAPDPSSQTVATLGGNIAENSGGPHTLKYGVTAPHILGLTLIDAEGEILELERGFGPDWIGMVVGSEGTLGVVTEAWVRLTPVPEHVETALACFGTVREASECVSAIISRGVLPAALEMMDRNILMALRAAFGLEFPDATQAMLLVECDGPREACRLEIEAVEQTFRDFGAVNQQRARDAAERAKLWTARKKGVGAMGRLAPSVVTHDGVIPRSKLPEMLDAVYEIAARYQIGVANLFHAGDGNLHPCFYFDDRDAKQVEAVVAAGTEVIQKCIELGGSVTGEHGIGVEKLDLMGLMFSPEDLAYQGRLKEIFGTNELCNPCKVLPNQRGCQEHRLRWRGVAT